MCGISCFYGQGNKSNIIQDTITSLSRLEYRGYDSSGISFINSQGKITTRKSVGEIKNLKQTLTQEDSSNIAISHTRWATHGKPNEQNSHPHSGGGVSLVHNGIIENYQEIKTDLQNKGYTFSSQTDTEAVLWLTVDLAKTIKNKKDIIKELFLKLKGTFALAILFEDEKSLYGLKNSSPMVFGCKKDGTLATISSDVQALAGFVTHFTRLEDGEFVEIKSQNSFSFFSKDGVQLLKNTEEISISVSDIELNGYETFMEKEIFEETNCIRRILANYFDETKEEITFQGVNFDLTLFNSIHITSCGSSHYASVIAKYILNSVSSITVELSTASEFIYKKQDLSEQNVLYIFISQSGETADTLKALKRAREEKSQSSKILSVVNVPTSTIANLSDSIIECFCGPEISVAATKSYLSQVLCLTLVALKIANKQEVVKSQILQLPQSLESLLSSINKTDSTIDSISQKVCDAILQNQKIIFLGRDILFGICLEATLKMQELCYHPVMCFLSGELKHGPIAMIDEKTLTIFLSHSQILFEKTKSSIQEVLARSGRVFLVSDQATNMQNIEQEIILPFVSSSYFTLPFYYIIFIQLLCCKTSKLLGKNVDKPRGLAKSVTVE